MLVLEYIFSTGTYSLTDWMYVLRREKREDRGRQNRTEQSDRETLYISQEQSQSQHIVLETTRKLQETVFDAAGNRGTARREGQEKLKRRNKKE